MTKAEAKKKFDQFIGEDILTFSIKTYPEGEWVAQCNEIDGIITCGKGFDLATMESLMQDAIFTAAGIPKDVSTGLMKRVWGKDTNVRVAANTEIKVGSNITLFPSTYISTRQHARVG